MSKESEVAIVLLNYNNWKETIDCISRLKSIGISERTITVVDNKSTDGSWAMLQKSLKKCVLIRAEVNNGFASGNNLGIKDAIARNFKFVCVMNSDIYFENDFLSPLVQELKNNQQLGIIGPCFRYLSDRKVVSQGGTFHLFSGKSRFNYTDTIYENRGLISCDYLCGGCVVTSARNIQKAGLIPEGYFLNYEDNEWCLNFTKAGLEVKCATYLSIFHEGESTINQISGLQKYFLNRNRVLFEKRNANILQKIIFFSRLGLSMLKQCLLKHNLDIVKSSLDGITEHNKYGYLIK